MIYRGDAWPEEFRENAFVADCGSNLVHRKRIYPEASALDGGGRQAERVGLKAERPRGEETVEFLASRDNWFRPVQLANAPDGNLYVIDMYREVIEHPWSLPLSIKKYLDLNSGNDRGRIYRIVPDQFKQPPVPRLGRATGHLPPARREKYEQSGRKSKILIKKLALSAPETPRSKG